MSYLAPLNRQLRAMDWLSFARGSRCLPPVWKMTGFEVALFGRVSSGKSSLLNALLGSDVLPVGVNPITAVPTKLRYGPELRAGVAYGDGRSRLIDMDELARLVTEQGNPGNLQNIVRAIVELPSARLSEGILLVDTPGLGSLAKRGDCRYLGLPAFLRSRAFVDRRRLRL